MEPVMNGMFDGFEGYRVATDADKRHALTTAVVAVDANVLLSLYRYNARTTQDLLTIFEKLGGRLVIPHQAMREFHRNRITVIGNPEQATRDARQQLEKARAGAASALETWSKQVALDAAEAQRLRAEVDQLFETLQAAVDGATPDLVHASTPTSEDRVLRRLAPILDGKVLPRPDEELWKDLIDQGKQRVEDSVPPGYLDAEKGDQHPEGAAGDFLVYVQACMEAETRKSDLVIITGDEKADWWWRRGAILIGPRQEMVKEFFDRGGRRLFLMRPSDLLLASDALDLVVNPESAKDAESARTPVDEVGEWTEDAVTMLLDRLRAEGRLDLTRVIVEAARQGGQLGRDEIYAVCGYADDRMLRGFTRPTARITADLQTERILPPSVIPMLTSLYREAGPLYAVRIPAEVVHILGSTTGVAESKAETEPAGKYQALTTFLEDTGVESLSLTFVEVEDIIGDTLAPSARKYAPYWNATQSSLGRAIAMAGYKVSRVRLDAETADLIRWE